MAHSWLIHVAVALVVSGASTLAIAFGIEWWKTLLLGVVWFISIVMGIREFRKTKSRDRRELTTWLTVGGDLLLTANLTTKPQEIVSVGPGFERVLGWEESEMVGKPWMDFVHPDDLTSSVAKANSCNQERPVRQFVNRWRHKTDLSEGQPRWVWLEWNAVVDKGLDRVYAAARDMTSRFEREAQMATWSRITSDLMAVTDTAVPMNQRKFEWINEAWSRQLGWDTRELYDMRIADLLVAEETPSRQTSRQTCQSDSKGEAVMHCRVLCKPTKDQPTRHLFYEWTSLSLNGKLYVTGRDIGGERLHQEEMTKAIDDLEARNADLERFASVAAHQLRSPPRTIAGIAQALEEDYGGVLDKDAIQFLEDIRKDADQMAEIVEGLYRFSKVRTGDLVVQPVDLNELLQSVYEQRAKQTCMAHHDLVWDSLPVVLGDKILLKEVFLNLIDNGFKFNESNPKRVGITCRQLEGDRWQLIVEDNGIGIDPKYQPKLFTMFQRVHTGYAGTGVGLALVAAIINKLGGSISVQSELGRGTSFTFDLAAAWAS